MAYEPTNWKTGDVVTSQKLNKLEQGVAGAGGVLVVTADSHSYSLNKTWQEIYDSPFAILRSNYDSPDHPSSNRAMICTVAAAKDIDEYMVWAIAFNLTNDNVYPYSIKCIANSPDGYPVMVRG